METNPGRCYLRAEPKSTIWLQFRRPVRLDRTAPSWHVAAVPTGRSRTMTARLSLVMPAYNEAAGIAEAIAEAHEALAGLGYEFEILVVDDGSTDRTAECVAELTAL